ISERAHRRIGPGSSDYAAGPPAGLQLCGTNATVVERRPLPAVRPDRTGQLAAKREHEAAGIYSLALAEATSLWLMLVGLPLCQRRARHLGLSPPSPRDPGRPGSASFVTTAARSR